MKMSCTWELNRPGTLELRREKERGEERREEKRRRQGEKERGEKRGSG
jgi:hypothetical protein